MSPFAHDRFALAAGAVAVFIAACGASVDISSATTGSGGGTTATSTGTSGQPDGGAPSNQLCAFLDVECTTSNEVPTCFPCTAVPQTQPTCGCDGKIYANACDALAAGVSVRGGCEPPPGTFPCGAFYCQLAAEYCRVDLTYDPANNTVHTLYSCLPFPSACGSAPDCSCLPQTPCPGSCGGECSASTDGSLAVLCCK